MADIYRELHRMLKPLCRHCAAVEYHFDGSLPEELIIYYIVDKTATAHFSNRRRRIRYQIGVDLLQRDGEKLDSTESKVIAALEAKGYRWTDNDPDAYIKDTGHYKRTLNFYFYTEV